MKTHFFVPWYGNKRKEFQFFEKYILLNNIDTIIEPFCGSCAFSFELSKKYPMKFQYILNDTDEDLIYLLKISKNDEELKRLQDDINNEIDKIKCKEDYNRLTGFKRWFIHRKYYYIRPGMYPEGKVFKKLNFDDYDILKFLRNEKIEIIKGNYTEIIEKYKNDNNVLMFIDPPYIMACNDFYSEKKEGINVYEWFYKNPIENLNAKYLIILEDNWIIKLLFNQYIKESYGKKYQPSKKNTNHVIITNFHI